MPLPFDSSANTDQGIPSGIGPIDREWGGLYRGGAYLVYGRAASGRGLFALRFVAAGLEKGEQCLFVASERFRDLAVEASSIGLDLRRARMQGLVRLTRVPPVVTSDTDDDESVITALTDLAALIRREQPERVVVNDFLPFVMFSSLDRFRLAFVEFLEALDGVDSTLLVALPEPANDQSARVVEFVSTKLTGTVHIEPFEYDPRSSERRLTLTPHVGHLGGETVCRWDLSSLVRSPSQTTGVSQKSHAPRPSTPAPSDILVEPSPLPVDTTPPVPLSAPEPPPRPVPEPAAAPSEPAEDAGVETPSEAPVPDAEREEFGARLENQFQRRERGGVPFLLIAMRLVREDNGATGPFDFEFIIDLVSDSLRSQDSFLVKPDAERLVVWLADSQPDEAQDFFARLRSTLEAEAPQRADQLLHAVSAIVVPDGRPFPTAAEFLSYALDEE